MFQLAAFQPEMFVKNLDKMGIGMLGIFIVIGVLIVSTLLLNKLTTRKKYPPQFCAFKACAAVGLLIWQ